ncbi:MAG: hypothetical protein ACREOO_01895 [bacterium]
MSSKTFRVATLAVTGQRFRKNGLASRSPGRVPDGGRAVVAC